jgi:hypothetical protein
LDGPVTDRAVSFCRFGSQKHQNAPANWPVAVTLPESPPDKLAAIRLPVGVSLREDQVILIHSPGGWVMSDIRTNSGAETIQDTCRAILLAGARRRLGQLEEIAAPSVMIEALRRNIEGMEQATAAGKLVRDPDGCSHFIWKICERQTGRGGKAFFRFESDECAPVNFFPQGKYGPFVSFEKKEV